MMTRQEHDEVLKTIRDARLVAILRGVPQEKLSGVVEALIAGGVRVLELTFDHAKENCVEDNIEKIRFVSENFGDRVIVGCGTALNAEEVEAAYRAGASLVVSPDCNEDVIKKTRELSMVSMPGALTPTEIVKAYRAGADIVKIFPAGELGMGFITALQGPLGFIPMSAVGGVKPETVEDFLNAGICGFGVGGQLVLSAAVKSGDFGAIEKRAREFTDAIARWEEKNQ